MDEHHIRKMLEGGGGAPGALLRAALWLPGKAYGTAMRLRRAAYRAGLLASRPAGAPVVSVGNLTAGGSGKTPFTIMLARGLAVRGMRPAILLRGYRQSDTGLSDEAVLYRDRCPEAILEVGSDRVAGAERAIAAGADVIIMDDGLQHLRLRRDMDIVLVDATAPWGGGNTIPGGLLREPRDTLAQASIVVVTRSDQVSAETLAGIRADAASLAPGVPVLTARHRPSGLRSLAGGTLPPDALRARKVVAMSGIARPEAFHKTLEQLGASLAATFAGRDHDHFDGAFLASALEAARRNDAFLVITEKDRAKKIFARLADNNSVDNSNVRDRIWTLAIDQEVEESGVLFALVSECISSKK